MRFLCPLLCYSAGRPPTERARDPACARYNMSALRGLGWSVFALVHIAGTALALDPRQPVSNYLRKDFTVEDGLPANQVNEIAQTDNGFLWVATDAGLARFDGQRFTLIRFRDDSSRELTVNSLLATPDGSLWVGTDSGLKQIP